VRKIRPPLLYVFEVAESESGVCLTKLAHFQGHLKVNFCFLIIMQFLSADSKGMKNLTFGYVVVIFGGRDHLKVNTFFYNNAIFCMRILKVRGISRFIHD